ncbi:type 1 fimbrial protein [Pseudomonas vanderleydeniana]|uniref:Type 1 fimbrial protein n=1 Tax=Pseudomonas vanderleydeniana TaxID=2745495 RepID=A0A9E6PP32_9PSED|nr:type 1 fimbrial protein [Pseudomonas vanderleydeniana]QXI29498.1 hypothetical protein HU752_005955 [Pseudomonas vanderleydeniana]
MKYTLSIFGVLLLMGVCSTVAAANAGQIRFSGQVVEAACEVTLTSTGRHGVSERIKVAPGVMLWVETADNACGNSILPFSTRFQALPGKASGMKKVSSQGIVTITYL